MTLPRLICRSPILAAAALVLATAPAAADTDFGVRAGVYTDIEEPFVGVELLMPVGRSSWYFNPNLEVVFVDPGDLVTLNIDFHYDFKGTDDLYVWAGGGPAVVFRDTGRDDETDLGANLLAGVGLKNLAFVPYLQGKVLLADETEGVIAIGIRF
ncbi:MAG TPA: hypothetical protein VMT16_06135 [Thermoanaerobaculia bacterium]|nr:hypothetical protein [Thermoanaerobaculia bacterium]